MHAAIVFQEDMKTARAVKKYEVISQKSEAGRECIFDLEFFLATPLLT